MPAKEKTSEFLTPNPIWETLGVNSPENFIDEFITRGKFHKNVPEVIQKDYKIVEQLQFYSYYNYPLIDEAFGKATRIFEASIDLKISDLGIEKEGFEPLNSKIKRLDKISSNELQKQWLHSKDLRNIFAHHKAGRLMGITLHKAFKHIINMINSVFLTHKEITDKENSLKELINRSEHLHKGLFIMEYRNQRFLVCSMVPYSTTHNGIEKSFWVFHPVYGEKLIKDVSEFPEPFMFNLRDLKIVDEGLSATVIETNEFINISVTNNPLNIQNFTQHLKQMLDIDLEIKQIYSTVLVSELNKGVTDFMYHYCWE